MKRTPEPLSLRYSRPWAIVVLVLVTAWTAYLAYVCYALQALITAPLAALIFVPWGALFVWQSWSSVRRLLHDGPVVTLDDHGITDLRRGGGAVPWFDVAGVQLAAAGGTCLMVRFRDLRAAREHLGVLSLPGALVNRIYNGGEWPVKLTSLRYSRKEVLSTAKAFIAQARIEARAA